MGTIKMTKNRILDRASKLKALAEGSSNPNEKAVAAKRLQEFLKKHNLKESDLDIGTKVEAFDKLADLLGTYAQRHPDLESSFGVSKIVNEILGHAKTELPKERKTIILGQISQGLRLAKLVMGNTNKTLNDVAGIVESILKTYNVKQ
jgi:hypothetical protein